MMADSTPRSGREKYIEIIALMKKHNISSGILVLVTGRTRSIINNYLNSNRSSLTEQAYVFLKDAIDRIVSSDIDPDITRGEVAEPRKVELTNRIAVREFLDENNIKFSMGSRILGEPSHYLATRLGLSSKYDISDSAKEEIIRKIKEYLDSNSKK